MWLTARAPACATVCWAVLALLTYPCMQKPPRRRHRASTEPPPGRKGEHAVKRLSERHIATFALLDPILGFKYLRRRMSDSSRSRSC
jgi:hypothetical protein